MRSYNFTIDRFVYTLAHSFTVDDQEVLILFLFLREILPCLE